MVTGESDGNFGAGDRVLFYGRSIDSLFYDGILPENKYTGENVYWLTYGGVNGQRMTPKDGSGSGTTVDTFRNQLHMETSFWYFTDRPFHLGVPMPNRFEPGADRWHWTWFRAQGATPNSRNPYGRNFSFFVQNISTCTLATIATCPPDGQITANFQGTYGKLRFSDPDDQHHIRLLINNTEVYTNPNAGHDFEQFTITAAVPHYVFADGSNSVRVELWNTDGNTYDEVYLNWIQIDYQDTLVAEEDRLLFNGQEGAGPWRYQVTNFTSADMRVFDVTDPFAPQVIANPTQSAGAPYSVSFSDSALQRRYVAATPAGMLAPVRIEAVTPKTSLYTPVDLLNTDNAADWIMITHGDFWDDALRLAQHRSSKYRVALVDVQRIYDQFNGGLRSSESIREFLRYAYHNWESPRPRFVVLMGDGNNDMRNYRYAEPTYIPPFLVVADPTLGETAVDNRYVTLVGDDILPDISIGRFPVSNLFEAATVVSKTIHYETMPFYDDWNRNVLLISDNLEGGGGNFYTFSDILADGYADPFQTPESKFLPDPYEAIKVYLGQTCADDTAPPLQCQQDIIDAINAGALFTSYIGHAVKTSWAVEPLVDGGVVNQLTNYDRLSIFLAMACFEGFFHEADGTVPLAEQYILSPIGGAVASWSPTGFGVATGHDYLEQGLFLAVFQDGVETLGEASDAGKYYLHEKAPAGKYDDLIDTFLLFGDPALQIQTWLTPTAVDMAGISATSQDNGLLVEWQTANELEIAGFNLLRSQSADGPFVSITQEPIWAANAGQAQGHSYQYMDSSVSDDLYWYQLEILRLNGSREIYGLVTADKPTAPLHIYLPALQR
jgi:hypothetical protein